MASSTSVEPLSQQVNSETKYAKGGPPLADFGVFPAENPEVRQAGLAGGRLCPPTAF
jgi:hypothetical protein